MPGACGTQRTDDKLRFSGETSRPLGSGIGRGFLPLMVADLSASGNVYTLERQRDGSWLVTVDRQVWVS